MIILVTVLFLNETLFLYFHKDSLLHSIKEEYVEAVELLLLWEEENHVPGEPYVNYTHIYIMQ